MCSRNKDEGSVSSNLEWTEDKSNVEAQAPTPRPSPLGLRIPSFQGSASKLYRGKQV